MIAFMEAKERVKEVEKCLDSQFWHACAGGMLEMPVENSKIFYFPQGHAEHASGMVDFRNFPRLPPYIRCSLSKIQFMADLETDEVYAKMSLIPISNSQAVSDEDDEGVNNGGEAKDYKAVSFAKTLTQSDANNGGGFSVPRYCAETIFPRLDYSADPPVQTILARDVHGETWKFRHIYRGTPRRHLLTTGWSTFVNHKKLVAGDSIVFLRAENGDLRVGIRRAKKGIGGSPEPCWNPAGGNSNSVMSYGGYGGFFREDENKLLRNGIGNSNGNGSVGKGKVRVESVAEAANLAANGQPFEVVYYPRAGTPEFCVKASMVKTALQIRWCSGMRFKMGFETEDSSRTSWFMGTISSVQVADPFRWPDSPWRLLQVTWDEPDLLQHVKRVSPWLVELVSNMPTIHLSPFSPPRKKSRVSQHPDFPLDSQFPMPAFSSNLLGPGSPYSCLPDNVPAGMQGARHAHYGLSLSDIHFNKLQIGLFPAGFPPLLDHAAATTTHARNSNNSVLKKRPSMSESVSCVLTMANSTHNSKKPDDVKAPHLVLFGKPILTEQQISLGCSGDTVSSVLTGNISSEGNSHKTANFSNGSGSASHQQSLPSERLQWYKGNRQENEPSSETGHCKVFMESEDVGRTVDLSLLGSYDELCRKLANMFRIENSESLNNVLYRDVTGTVKHIGDEPFGKEIDDSNGFKQ
ncbi:auxin response factor 18-like isoform X2 [Euphorbia lathyris]|uniref:auxin response factor 18-like isoform X2 n=1 Tax=Euphorbia lathyris TaxID=212925 RepID=UPI003313F0A9